MLLVRLRCAQYFPGSVQSSLSFHSVTYKVGIYVELASPVRRLGLLAGFSHHCPHVKNWGSSLGVAASSPASPALELPFLPA